MKQLVLLLPLWLALAVGEPSLVHPCPMHGALVQATSGGEHGAHQHHGAVPGQNQDSRHECSCIDGCAASATAFVAAPAEVPLATIALREPRTLPASDFRARFISARVLPYPNGPPV